MRFIRLHFRDSNVFGAHLRPDRLSLLYNCLDTFMTMYKEQGTTFWLRLLITFKYHVENCIDDIKSSDCYPEALKILNSLYINIHKKFIEGDTNTVSQFMQNLLTATLNLNNVYALVVKDECVVPKSLKPVFHNVYCLPDFSEDFNGGFIMFISLIYCNFLSVLSTIFSQFEYEEDLCQKELSEIDKKLIYWVHPLSTAPDTAFMCFDRYICDFWKEDFPKMVLPKYVGKYYDSHPYSSCCEHARKGNILSGIDKNKIDATSLELYNIYDEKIKHMTFTNGFETVTRKSMKCIRFVTPVAATCKNHENCWLRIKHDESCLEPYLCNGSEMCIKICDYVLNSDKREDSIAMLDDMSVEIFCTVDNKRDVSTMVGTQDKTVETYVSQIFACPSSTRDCPSPDICMSFHSCQYNQRKEECLSRLRKKFRQKHSSDDTDLDPYSLQDPDCQTFVMKIIDCRMKFIQEEFCTNNKDIVCNSPGDCFWRAASTVAIGSHHVFGLVVSLTKVRILVPRNAMTKKIAKKTDTNNSSPLSTHMIAPGLKKIEEIGDVFKGEIAFERKKKESGDNISVKEKPALKKQKTCGESTTCVGETNDTGLVENACTLKSDISNKKDNKTIIQDTFKDVSENYANNFEKESTKKTTTVSNNNSMPKKISNKSEKKDVKYSIDQTSDLLKELNEFKSALLSFDKDKYFNYDFTKQNENISCEQNSNTEEYNDCPEWEPEVEEEINWILKVLGIKAECKPEEKKNVNEDKVMDAFLQIIGVDQ